jgi:hypothetical protein
MTNALLELYRHKTWATLRLIEHCQRLDDKDLDATIPGTYGTIRDTLRHLVDSEEGYYSILTRKRFPTKEVAAVFSRPGALPAGPAEDAELPDREVTTTDGFRLPGAVPMAQAIHHADDHRSHVLSILGARGLEVPLLDVWDYAESAGLMQEL